MRDVVGGHFWTVAPLLRYGLRPPKLSHSEHFRTYVEDDDLGRIKLTGRLHEASQSSDRRDLVVMVHGLGGAHDSHYLLPAVEASDAAGLSTLRINLRGADQLERDFYHAGLVSDLHAILGSERLRSYERFYLLGYSLGGHIVLRYLTEKPNTRVAAAAAICPPLSLAQTAKKVDQPPRAPYRHYALRKLKEHAYNVARRGGELPISLEATDSIKTLRDWDERIVAPRFGFDSASDYWQRASVAPRLDRVQVPALIVASKNDPMVLFETIEPALREAWNVRKVYLKGQGHAGFSDDVDLGLGVGEQGIEAQLMRWFKKY